MTFDIIKIKRSIKNKKDELFPSMAKKMRYYYAENYEDIAVDNNLVLYETRDGKSIVDSPYAIFLELANSSEYSHLRHIWVIDDNSVDIKNSIPHEFRERVSFVSRGTLEYVKALLEAKYLISNATFEAFFTKKSEQIYINTWHGTPLKHMGFDIPGSVNHSQNVLRNFLMTDYILSPNNHTTNIFVESYKLKGLYPGKILEGGYPRIDLTLNSDKDEIKEKIKSYGTKLGEKPILLFCPTWKGTSIHNTSDDIDQIISETLTLVNKFKDKYEVLLKVHPFVFNKMKEEESIKTFLISDLVDANEVLSVVDVLITDYSSIFFDFLVTKKPIIFYSWDKDMYAENRGMYLNENQFPGPTAENINELVEFIEDIDNISIEFKQKYKELADLMVPYEDGNVTKKYIQYIFKDVMDENITIYDVNSNKKKLLIYPGGMVNNGITSSFLNLIDNIDYEKYDVTVIANSNNNIEINNNLKKMNKNVRPLFRFGMNILSEKDTKIDKVFNAKGIKPSERDKYPEKSYKREMNRLTGNIEFDVAIDFSGYSYYWARHILSTNANKYVIFMHNDLKEDSQKVINGKQLRKQNLEALFTIYYKFDKILSVSPMTRDVNLKKLSEFVTEEKMSFVYNSINVEHILSSGNNSQEEASNPLEIKKENKLVRETVEVPYYKNMDELAKGNSKSVFLEQNASATQHASILINETKYGKMSVNSEYIGWIDEKYFENRPSKVIERKKYHAYGTVSRGDNYTIWKELRTNTDSDIAVTTMNYFKGRYIEIRELAITEDGHFYHVYYCNKELGWVSRYPIQRIHEVSLLNPFSIYFKSKMMKQENETPVIYPNKVDRTEKYAKLNSNKEVSIWSKPDITLDALEFNLTEDYFEEYFVVVELSYFDSKTYCKLELADGSFVGFVKEDMLLYLTEDEFESAVSNQSKTDELVLPKIDLGLQKVPEFDSTFFNFVNMGRLSPEKNQKQLISAFAKFNQDIPNSRLYILGKGPLENELIDQIRELNLETKVILLGHLPSPFSFIKMTDYFILPSFYEGQPMVLLESLTIKMNILASNIPANINVIGQNEEYGLLINGTSEEAIYQGMHRAYNHEGSFKEFYSEDYNIKAMKSFYDAIN
ncbi:CDP-glycerol glycerophosphotransferase family protein [Vagococcus fluvialis]|uniref:CDP-glycerol glycerophosphotransferase family protein n=1 Tax=Vagococcus fluvialis TaxID=2738 RepID=UPI001D09B9A4|nr:CDP-glycerol glycerophosphotransferase family protein [Vagococcus fluvialis]UDM73823.1 CDP-glycerol glycerophosphotransferase family protein [Vagococcus fluvialis]